MAFCTGQHKPYSKYLSLDFDNQKWYQSTLKNSLLALNISTEGLIPRTKLSKYKSGLTNWGKMVPKSLSISQLTSITFDFRSQTVAHLLHSISYSQ
ncbi:hypothetical protein Hanom_Chr01g00042611 [Helianthus anomalus]